MCVCVCVCVVYVSLKYMFNFVAFLMAFSTMSFRNEHLAFADLGQM